MDLENLDISPGLREKVKTSASPEELLALAKKEGGKYKRHLPSLPYVAR